MATARKKTSNSKAKKKAAEQAKRTSIPDGFKWRFRLGGLGSFLIPNEVAALYDERQELMKDLAFAVEAKLEELKGVAEVEAREKRTGEVEEALSDLLKEAESLGLDTAKFLDRR